MVFLFGIELCWGESVVGESFLISTSIMKHKNFRNLGLYYGKDTKHIPSNEGVRMYLTYLQVKNKWCLLYAYHKDTESLLYCV